MVEERKRKQANHPFQPCSSWLEPQRVQISSLLLLLLLLLLLSFSIKSRPEWAIIGRRLNSTRAEFSLGNFVRSLPSVFQNWPTLASGDFRLEQLFNVGQTRDNLMFCLSTSVYFSSAQTTPAVGIPVPIQPTRPSQWLLFRCSGSPVKLKLEKCAFWLKPLFAFPCQFGCRGRGRGERTWRTEPNRAERASPKRPK